MVSRRLDLKGGNGNLSFQLSEGDSGDFLLQNLTFDLSTYVDGKLNHGLGYFSADDHFTEDKPHAVLLGGQGQDIGKLKYSFLVFSVTD